MKRKTQSKATQTSPAPFGTFPDFAELWAEQQQMLDPRRFLRLSEDALNRANGTLLGDTAEITHEFMTFGNERLKRNLEFASRFMKCETGEDVAKVQQDWLRTAFQDYRNGSEVICEKCMNFVSDSMKIAAENASTGLKHEVDTVKESTETS